jgi:hypothetical protein
MSEVLNADGTPVIQYDAATRLVRLDLARAEGDLRMSTFPSPAAARWSRRCATGPFRAAASRRSRRGSTASSARLDEELAMAASGHGVFKSVRGDYGSGKTFFSRWLQHRAQAMGFATSEVQINETETPLHRMETVYRRAMENLRTREWDDGAFRSLVGRWFFSLEEEVSSREGFDANDAALLSREVSEVLERASRGQPHAARPSPRPCGRATAPARRATTRPRRDSSRG